MKTTKQKPKEKALIELRASKIGGCPRAYVMDLRKGEKPITPRQKIYYGVGKALEPIIMEAAGYDPAILFQDQVVVRIQEDGFIFTGHPDSEDHQDVIECKTMRSFAWKKANLNGIEAQFPQYLIQGSIYCKGRGKEGVRFLCLDKDASEIMNIRVDWATLEPYYQKAVKNAKAIIKWLGKTKLPGRPKDLPRWYCYPAYCNHTECSYHLENNRKPEHLKRKKS